MLIETVENSVAQENQPLPAGQRAFVERYATGKVVLSTAEENRERPT